MALLGPCILKAKVSGANELWLIGFQLVVGGKDSGIAVGNEYLLLRMVSHLISIVNATNIPAEIR